MNPTKLKVIRGDRILLLELNPTIKLIFSLRYPVQIAHQHHLSIIST